MPCIENVAVVASDAALANVTAPGPLTLLHVVVTDPRRHPSSVAVPDSDATLTGNVIVWSPPASTTGARLMTPSTVTVTTSVAESSPSSAVSCRT